ncbi:Membrane-bound lytic murein transglycosylase B [hydrothermal vent metagenome]|uniref:Membrane-bound lytic murein transglycosylase B n=1 Tax=hydrothermal vent metagenome TaxID=652676 RepID=A0A3B1AB22_9ZZZZ
MKEQFIKFQNFPLLKTFSQQLNKFIYKLVMFASVFNLIAINSLSALELDDPKLLQSFINDMTVKHQFDAQYLIKLFEKTKKHQSILDAIARPAEGKPWYDYRPIFVTEKRIKGGIAFYKKNNSILKLAFEKYGVPSEIVVSIIGVETRYGGNVGSYPVIDSLSTLAFAYPPRSKFFKSELEHFLLMTRDEKINPLEQVGSYAGAMGMPQFMPSSFREYAIDFDADGKRDLWTNRYDVIGSVSNYFIRHGWKKDQPIASKVKVYGNRFNKLLSKSMKPQWSQKDLLLHGVALPEDLPKDIKGSFMRFETKDGPEYWVGWTNFYVITRYNHSILYAMSVFQLSEYIRDAEQAKKYLPAPAS